MSEVIKDSLKEMYDLGFKHGYELGRKDLTIEQLEKEIEELATQAKAELAKEK
jgi:hypothetical protein